MAPEPVEALGGAELEETWRGTPEEAFPTARHDSDAGATPR